MNGTSHGLPKLNDVHIPPLRNPALGSRNDQAPLPLELTDHEHLDNTDRLLPTLRSNEEELPPRGSQSAPIEPASKDSKKPHLAISELVETHVQSDNAPLQLPSFVSLSVVEKSPTQAQLHVSHDFPNKRPRLDTESDLNRFLPRPVQKDDKQVRQPLLPAMVTGLHEPPPSADLLPPMDPDARPVVQRNTTSKMEVKDMLSAERSKDNRPPEQMLNTPHFSVAELPKVTETETTPTDADTPSTTAEVPPPIDLLPKRDPKVRRARRKWTEAESQDLLAGVKKHGFGKWKQILNDTAYKFVDRTSIDLKDRFRVFAKDYPETQADPTNSDDVASGTAGRPERKESSQSKQRRKRHPWTKEEDAALLQGVQQYGFQWTDIHKDAELGLNHRRATDLRDRVRNLYPDGYKHAEARPLRAEVKKQEKATKKETPAGTLYAPPGQMDSMNFSSSTNTSTAATATSQRNATRRQTTSGKVASIASLTQSPGIDDAITLRPMPRRTKTVAEPPEQSGITLPSLAIDDADDNNEWDNTLPPFVNWEHEI